MKYNKSPVRRLLATSAFAAFGVIGVGGAAGAQTAQPDTVEEVIVTATRRATELQETPLAVTAIGGEQLERDRVQSLDDTLLLVPNANFINATGGSGSYASLRGSLTADDAPGVDLPVTFFIDDIFYGSAASAYPDFFDVQQVEVLRGPQGTTFGRNVTGGAIVIRSREPSDTFGASLSGTLGDNGRYEARGHVTGPLSESVAGRLAFSVRKYDGYQTNLFNGNSEGGQEFYSLRGMIAFDFGERTRALLNVNYTIDRSAGVGYTFAVFGNGPSMPGFAGVEFPSNPDHTNGNVTPENDRTNLATSLRVEHDLGFATLTSITAFRNSDTAYLNDADGTPLNIQTALDTQVEDQWTQELRLTSNGEGQFEWIAGLYAFNQKATRVEAYNHDAVVGTTLFYLVPFHLEAKLTQDIETTSIAPYVEGVFRITPQWAVRAGVRYTWEKKSGITDHRGVNRITTFPVEYRQPYREDWEAFTPRFALEYTASDSLFFYASASRGFKSGGYTLNPTTAAQARIPFDPEYVWSYELGMRSDWFDNRFRFNATLFKQETKDLQVRSWNGVAFAFTNAAGTEAQGVEIEALLRPTRNIDIGMSYGWMDAQYTDYACSPGVNCAGKEFPFVPTDSLSVFGNARFPLGGGRGEIFTRFDAQYRSKMWFTANNNNPRALYDQSDIEGLYNAQIGWESEDGRWRATLWGKNLTDERHLNFAVDLSVFYLDQIVLVPGITGTESGEAVWRTLYNPGRSYGFTLTRDF